MLDYGLPEPHPSPIIAPGDSKATCKKKGIPLPARPDWLCLTSAEYHNSHSSYNYEAKELTDEEIEAKEKRKQDREAAREALRDAHLEAAMKREDERRAANERASRERQKKRAEDQKRLLLNKTRDKVKEARQRNMAKARDARVFKMAQNLKEIPPQHIRELRLSRGLTLDKMARLLGVTHAAITAYESGRCTMGTAVKRRFEEFEKESGK